jgi:hypothetical protein
VVEEAAALRDGLRLLVALPVQVWHIPALEEERVRDDHLLAGRSEAGALVDSVVAVVFLGCIVLFGVVLGADKVIGDLLRGAWHDHCSVCRKKGRGHGVAG